MKNRSQLYKAAVAKHARIRVLFDFMMAGLIFSSLIGVVLMFLAFTDHTNSLVQPWIEVGCSCLKLLVPFTVVCSVVCAYHARYTLPGLRRKIARLADPPVTKKRDLKVWFWALRPPSLPVKPIQPPSGGEPRVVEYQEASAYTYQLPGLLAA